jgi:hypothetical protein
MRGIFSLVLLLVAVASLNSIVDRFNFRNAEWSTTSSKSRSITGANATIEWSEDAATRENNSNGLDLTRSPHSTPPPNDIEEPEWQKGIYNGSICPGLLQAAYSIVNSTKSYSKLKVLMMQMEGNWSDSEVSQVYHLVYLHNARVAHRLGYSSVSITNTSSYDCRVPAYAKILAIKEYCMSGEYDLAWFIDGDVVLMNPDISIELVWYYYLERYPRLDALFSVNNDGLNSGVFIVNCRSETAIRFLNYWYFYADIVTNWHNVERGVYEQPAVQWLLQVPIWKRRHPRIKRKGKLAYPNVSQAEIRLFSEDRLGQRVVEVDAACHLAVYAIRHMCLATIRAPTGNVGPLWWEDGHWMVHMAGIRENYLRLPYVLELIVNATKIGEAAVAPSDPVMRLSYFLKLVTNANANETKMSLWLSKSPSATIQEAAQQYIHHYQNRTSSNPPLTQFDYLQCKSEENLAKQLYSERQNQKLDPTLSR